MRLASFAVVAGGALLFAWAGSPSVADVVSDWNTAVIPPPPELKEVTVDPSTTALLFLDIMKAGCTARPRCVAAVPNMKRLHEQARAHNMGVLADHRETRPELPLVLVFLIQSEIVKFARSIKVAYGTLMFDYCH
jgi:hypothetical protein